MGRLLIIILSTLMVSVCFADETICFKDPEYINQDTRYEGQEKVHDGYFRYQIDTRGSLIYSSKYLSVDVYGLERYSQQPKKVCITYND